ncbi:hypothetical protein [Pararhizobium gei]|uniref:hypothetical protein n=1 Tax=Pararhizobium gei TaxID=1395951 RepID=UPI0023D99418|nr:hypothetical protein [Rhizobium gei]
MNRHHIDLTGAENALVERIDLRDHLPSGEDPHVIYLANREPILALLQSLNDRKAIPPQRLAYWNDPAYTSGPSKLSRKEVFESNGTYGPDIFAHPHFRRYLRYFLYGADLPAAAIREFEQQLASFGTFSGSDIIALTAKTREIVRRHRLTDDSVPDEFFKLALDNGLDRHAAKAVRRDAMQAKRR